MGRREATSLTGVLWLQMLQQLRSPLGLAWRSCAGLLHIAHPGVSADPGGRQPGGWSRACPFCAAGQQLLHLCGCACCGAVAVLLSAPHVVLNTSCWLVCGCSPLTWVCGGVSCALIPQGAVASECVNGRAAAGSCVCVCIFRTPCMHVHGWP